MPYFIPLSSNDPNKAFNARLKLACERARVPVISAYPLRHTAATLLLNERGANLRDVQQPRATLTSIPSGCARSSETSGCTQNNSLTRLLTDERANEEMLSLQKKTEQEKTLEEVLKTVKNLAESQKKGWWPFRKRALEAEPAMHRTHLSS